MKVTRRRAVVGIGAALAVGTSVMASAANQNNGARGVEGQVQFRNDSKAFLGIGPANVPGRDSVTVEQNRDGVVTLEIEQVNRNAVTAMEDILALTNNGERPIASISVTANDESQNAVLTVENDFSDVGTIEVGETVTGLGLRIDTTDQSGNPTIQGTILIRALMQQQEEL